MEFLETFYDTISFKANEVFKSNQFRSLFIPNAILVENTADGVDIKTVEDHISEFEMAIKNHPLIFSNGFIEKQTSYEILNNDKCKLIKSNYSKSYTRNGEYITETGTNMITLININNSWKISSVVW